MTPMGITNFTVDKAKILIVDDNADYLRMLTDFLADNDYIVQQCSDGKEAQDIFSEFMPDIVLTDVIMPGVDGIELLLSLRSINPEIRVIVMSGGNSGYADTYLHMANKLGANVILNKPFDLSELLAQVKMLESAA